MPPDSDSSPQPLQNLGSGLSPAQSYRPSTLVLLTIILLTFGSVFGSVFIPYVCIFFCITTYGPTLHFAVTGIVRDLGEISSTDTDVLKAYRKSRNLTCIWVLSIALHFLLYWSFRGYYAGVALVPTLSGIPATLLLLCVSVRCGMDVWWTQKEGQRRLPRDEEEHSTEPRISPSQSGVAVHAVTTLDQYQSKTHITLVYQPGTSLLCFSILITVTKIVFELKYSAVNDTGPISASLLALPAYAPTIITHLYLIRRFSYGSLQTFEEGVKFGSWLYELLSIWISSLYMELMILYFGDDKIFGMIESSIKSAEIIVIGYMAVRYSRSVRREWKWMRENVAVGQIETPADDQSFPALPVSELASINIQNSYQPSFFTLAIYAGLSIACTVIETNAELICGGPMSIFVYIPTAYMCVLVIVRRCLRSRRYEKANERWQQLCALWILTQVFYLLVWPISQYLRADVMQPWVRWPAVAISVYIAGRYWRDSRLLKAEDEGIIRLPPDSDTETNVPVDI